MTSKALFATIGLFVWVGEAKAQISPAPSIVEKAADGKLKIFGGAVTAGDAPAAKIAKAQVDNGIVNIFYAARNGTTWCNIYVSRWTKGWESREIIGEMIVLKTQRDLSSFPDNKFEDAKITSSDYGTGLYLIWASREFPTSVETRTFFQSKGQVYRISKDCYFPRKDNYNDLSEIELPSIDRLPGAAK